PRARPPPRSGRSPPTRGSRCEIGDRRSELGGDGLLLAGHRRDKGLTVPECTLAGTGGDRLRTIGIVMNGVTGRMGRNQHLIRSILAIRERGGLALESGEVIWPEPLLVGRSEKRLRALADETGVTRWTTDLAGALADSEYPIYFDAQLTALRAPAVQAAIEAGRHVYCEKPLTGDLESSLDLARRARAAGVKTGVVQDKLFLPGLRKLRSLVDAGFFGRIIAVRGEFGYWVHPGPDPPAQRPSWNY